MIYDFTNTLYKTVVNCFFFEFTVNGWACNTHFINNARNGDTAVFDGFLQDFALVRHRIRLIVTPMQICTE